MPDVLTHVLVGYLVGTILTAVREEVGPAEVTLVMAGALSPDVVKIKLLVPAASVEVALGVPFSWEPLHTAVGQRSLLRYSIPAGGRYVDSGDSGRNA